MIHRVYPVEGVGGAQLGRVVRKTSNFSMGTLFFTSGRRSEQ